MSVDGIWTIVVKSPLGEQPSTLSVKNEGGALTGTLCAHGQSLAIAIG